jgi:hypothetical protein
MCSRFAVFVTFLRIPVIPDTPLSGRSDAVIFVSYPFRFISVKSAFAFLVDPPFS